MVESTAALTTKLTDYSLIALFLVHFFLEAMVKKREPHYKGSL